MASQSTNYYNSHPDAKKKKQEGGKGKTVVKNTPAATVKLRSGGLIKGKRSIARGCGAVKAGRRKKTLYI